MSKSIMSFEEADGLTDKIIEFLRNSGGLYSQADDFIGDLEARVLKCLSSGQYCIREVDGEITDYAGYWLVSPDDLEIVSQGGYPDNISNGDTLCVCDAACDAMWLRRTLRKIKFNGCAWTNWKRQREVIFTEQKGA